MMSDFLSNFQRPIKNKNRKKPESLLPYTTKGYYRTFGNKFCAGEMVKYVLAKLILVKL